MKVNAAKEESCFTISDLMFILFGRYSPTFVVRSDVVVVVVVVVVVFRNVVVRIAQT